MGKKKPFIDKKNASAYHLIRRSQRDVGGYYDEETGEPLDVPREFVLMPTPETRERIQNLKQQQQLQQQQQQHDEGEKGQYGHHHRHYQSAQDALSRAKAKLQAANLVDDYDYERHMMPITGNGAFISKDGGTQVDPFMDARSKNVPIVLQEPIIKEVDRQLESIAITADCMDDDVAEALFHFEEGGFEELLDDFCLTAAQEPEEEGDEEEDEEGNGGFDFDAHIERLIQKARMEENGGQRVVLNDHEAWVKSASEFQHVRPLKKGQDEDDEDDDGMYDDDEEEEDDEDEFYHDDDVNTHDLMSDIMNANPGVVAKLKPEEEKALCEKFEQTLLEYDSDDVGDLDDDYMNIRGEKPLEGDVQIEAALDQFLQEKKDENFIAGTRHLQKRQGGCSRVYVDKKLVPFNALDAQGGNKSGEEEEEGKEQETSNVYEMLAEADKILANPEMDLPPEEILIDGKSYFTMKERNPWDCESILSTYSNLDNNPAVIGRSNHRRTRKKKNRNRPINDDVSTIHEEQQQQQQPVQILLSNKTGLPLGVLPERTTAGRGMDDLDDDQQGTFVSVNKGIARKKNETAEEKRARKKAIKEERQIARIQKKIMREAIQEELSKRTGHVDVDDVAGKSVFRYS